MNATTTPPAETLSAAGAPRPPGSGSRAIAIVAIVLGCLVLLSTVASAALGTIASATERTSARTLATAGVESLEVSVGAGALHIWFDDVPEAQLESTGPWGADRWVFERRGDRLVVATPNRFGLWIGDWLSWGDDRGGTTAVLRLPQTMAGSDAELSLSAGQLIVEGDFDELELRVSAGWLEASGSASEVSARVSAGRGDLELSGVEEAVFGVSAGALYPTLTGTQPDEIEATVSAGTLQLTVPEGRYAVSSSTSAGRFDNRIGSDPRSTHRIDVRVSAGQVVLRTAD